jgi:Fe-S oxidoreductase
VSWVLIVGLLINAVALPLAARRVWFLYRVVSSGQPAPDRIEHVKSRLGGAAKRQLVEVFGQRKMLKWTVPGTAHFFVMWAFFILATVYLEAYAVLLSRDPEWSWFVFGNWSVLGFLQDFIAVMATIGIAVFWAIRLRNQPKEMGRRSRFFGSHLGPAYFTLFMIFNVVWTLFLFRGAVEARDAGTDNGYGKAAFVSYLLGRVLPDSTALIGIGLILHIGVMLVFLIFVLNSKHLHIFVAPLNVMFGREPVALGAAKPLMSGGKPVTLDDVEDLDEDAKLGVGAAEDFSWKGILDMATCTECGRCQDQCPAWNTEKPLSPKLLIMALRDHTMAKAPYLLADEGKREALAEGNATLTKELDRPLVGDTGDEWFYMPEDGSGVIDPDVLWSCVTCGACVQQCPVDIEHVDHIVDMRRYQVLVESNFPAELNQLFKGMENKGNPWNLSASARLDWAKDLPFEVKVVGDSIESLDEVDWLFWVGCAGAYEDRAKKTTRAVAELLDLAGVSFGVLGNGETCTGDSARRAGNEFLFQGLAQQNVETFKEHKVKKVVSTCAHCFNTLKNEYKEFGIELEVVHHTQLLNRLVREGKLTPVAEGAGAAKRTITYHDPCYIGRHNQVYEPPRELLQVMPGAEFTEMPRNAERSFCCGAGGARMWMEENLGTRINVNRTKEAVATGADQIAVGCPFCRVMLSDGLTAEQSDGNAREEVEVLDVAQMLLASVKGESATRAKKVASNGAPAAAAPAEAKRDEATKDEPEAGDATQTRETVTEPAEVGPAAKASGGSSLFDVEEDAAETPSEPATEAEKPKGDGGSLFDLGESEDTESEKTESTETPKDDAEEPAKSGGSLFDIEAPEEPAAKSGTDAPPAEAAPAEEAPTDEPKQDDEAKRAEPTETPEPSPQIPEGGSLFDIEAPAEPAASTDKSQPTAGEHESEEAEVAQPEADSSETASSGAALSQAATSAASDEAPADGVPADDSSPSGEPEKETGAQEPAEKKRAQSSGEAHQPKTGVDIDESNSLFDL